MEKHGNEETGYNIKNIILGGQDGLVNVLGVILAVATATQDVRIVIIAGLAATFAESISMAAVAYTSAKSVKDFYSGETMKEAERIRKHPATAKKEIKSVFFQKGFRGPLLASIVTRLTADRKLWLKTIMDESHYMDENEYKNPLKDALVVGVSALVGSLVPLAPFFFADVGAGIALSLIFSLAVLFITGAIKGRMSSASWLRSGIEIALIGMAAAIIGYAIGVVLGAAVYV